MTFLSRQDAGQRLAQRLLAENVQTDLLLALPRGGVIVAAEVARQLQCPLEVLPVRKIGHPRFREFAVGALAEPDVVVLDEDVVARSHVRNEDLQRIIAEEGERLKAYAGSFAPTRRALDGRTVAIVDDGLATGATMEAAVRSARKRGAARILVAIPVASTNGAERIERVADGLVALHIDPDFEAVGQYYRSFPQTSDAEVLAALQETSQRG